MVKKNFLFALAALVAMEANAVGFKTLSMAEGIEMAKGNPKAVIVDVRRDDEYKAGHIPGALLLTLEKITKESAAKVLPDKSQMIFIYCRSGRRSKIAGGEVSFKNGGKKYPPAKTARSDLCWGIIIKKTFYSSIVTGILLKPVTGVFSSIAPRI